MTILLFIAGLALLVLGAEMLVRGASRIAAAAGISHLVIGLTVVAFGTSAPELAVTTAASLSGEPDLALGNVVGSNIFNVLFVLGVAALFAPLAVSARLVRLEVPVMIGSSILLLVLALDGGVSRGDGLLLLAGALAYTVFLFVQGRSAERAEDARAAAAGEAPPPPFRTRDVLLNAALGMAGLALLVLGSRWLVDGARVFALALGVSELVVGLTIVAIGTSLPELATSLVASLRGQREIAVGNAVGSNLFNVLLILGTAAAVSPDGVPASAAAIRFDLPVMVGVSLVCFPVFFTGLRIARWEGVLFLAYYAAYTGYIVLAATHHDAIDEFRFAMLYFVLPLTALTLVTNAIRAHRRR